MKYCTKCEKSKLDEFFYFKNEETGTRQSYCIACAYDVKQAQKRKNAIAWYAIVGCVCIHCGYSKNHVAIDFHHRDPEDKLFHVSGKFREYDPNTCTPEMKKQILLETAKCDMLCANCHRELHNTYK